MAQVDRVNGLVGDLGVKAPCNCATTAPIVLSGEQTVDGYACTATDNGGRGSRVLVKNQQNAVENGVYYCDLLSWARAPDFDGPRDVSQGTQVLASQGTLNGGYSFQVETPNPVLPGSSPITFAGAANGRGSVTSVALALPSDYAVTGSPITTFGTLTAARVSQPQGLFLASPSAGAGVPVYRGIAVPDVPVLNQPTTGNAATATTASNLAGGAAGDIPYQDGAGSTLFLPNGTAGQILTSQGGAAAPTWSAAQSGGSPIFSAGVPALSSWTTFNFTGASTAEGTVTNGTTTALSVVGMLNGPGTDNLQGIYLTAPTAPYRIAAAVVRNHSTGNYQTAGIGYYTSGKLVVLSPSWPNAGQGICVIPFASLTSSSSALANATWQQTALGLVWLGLYNDGTNINYQFSTDSVNWITIYTEAIASGYLAGAYSNPMLCVDDRSVGGTDPVSITCLCWDENGLNRTLTTAYG